MGSNLESWCLQNRTTVADVEASCAAGPPPAESWLREWGRLRHAMQPGDELWEFDCGRAGYAVVRHDEVVDNIPYPQTWLDEPLIPTEWLRRKLSVAKIEASFREGEYPPVEDWLREWRRLRDAMQPGDELWEYASGGTTWAHLCGRAGYAVVRDGKVVDEILTAMS